FYILLFLILSFLFFSTDTSTTKIYTLSLHDALPIYLLRKKFRGSHGIGGGRRRPSAANSCPTRGSSGASSIALRSARTACSLLRDRKSTRLNSSHDQISYAVFCLKKKKKQNNYISIS